MHPLSYRRPLRFGIGFDPTRPSASSTILEKTTVAAWRTSYSLRRALLSRLVAQAEEGVQLDELAHEHLTPTVQDTPEPLPARADTTCRLGHRDAPFLLFRPYEETGFPTICHEQWTRILKQKAIATCSGSFSSTAGDKRTR